MSEGTAQHAARDDGQQRASQDATTPAEAGRLEVAFGPALVEAFAHRVRSCITAIGAAGDYMLEANLPPDKQREMLYIIEDEVAAIADLLSDFLVVAGKSAVGDVGPLTSVDLSSVTKRMVHRLASNAQSMGAWLAADASEPCPPVLGDEHLLQQAVLSALRSVLRLARAGDRVVASLRPGPAQSSRGPQVELTISVEPKDGEGTGGAARRAGKPDLRGKPDLQLGDLPLVSVRMIAEQHGGEVSSLTDRVGISLTLPGAPLHTRPQAGALARAVNGGAGPTLSVRNPFSPTEAGTTNGKP